MRVITGTARGRRLAALPGNDVRPTPQRVKEAVFSAIQFDVEGRRFLDLFAGSGQMGIEALSRGAAFAQFVDASDESAATVRKNLETVGFSDRARVEKSEYAAFLAGTSEKFDIAFLDPPYHLGILNDALKQTARIINDYGMIICEHPSEVVPDRTAGGFQLSKQYRYGIVNIAIYRKGD